jgi:hypothetical protein
MHEPLSEVLVKATPGARARPLHVVAGIVAGLLVSGAAALVERHERDLVVRHQWAQAHRDQTLILQGLAAFCLLLVVAVFLPMALHGARIVAAGRWPLAGARVAVDTPVVRGRRAVVRGLAILVFALIWALLCLHMGSLVWQGSTVLPVPAYGGK